MQTSERYFRWSQGSARNDYIGARDENWLIKSADVFISYKIFFPEVSQINQSSCILKWTSCDLSTTLSVWGCCWTRTLLFLLPCPCQHRESASPFNNSEYVSRERTAQPNVGREWQRTPDLHSWSRLIVFSLALRAEGCDERQAIHKVKHLQKYPSY